MTGRRRRYRHTEWTSEGMFYTVAHPSRRTKDTVTYKQLRWALEVIQRYRDAVRAGMTACLPSEESYRLAQRGRYSK